MTRLEADLVGPLDGCSRRAARAWLWAAVGALLVAGLFALLLVLSRTPLVQDLLPARSFFRTALVVHVNLSVLVWFLCLAGLIWSLQRPSSRLETIALGAVFVGVLLMTLAPFFGAPVAYLNNYIPTVESTWFGAGLLSFGAGIALQAARACAPGRRPGWRRSVIAAAAPGAALVYLLALAITLSAWFGLADTIAGEARYELMFWGGGHVLQLTHTLLLVCAWIVLLQACGTRWPVSASATGVLLVLAALTALYAPAIDIRFALDSLDYRRSYTDLMRYAGFAAMPLLALVVWAWWRGRGPLLAWQRPLRAALTASLLLFAVGGAIGFLIEGVNVVIPAHYHGSIVGVTLAFMGFVYWVLPQLGYPTVSGRLPGWQPFVYGGGQLLHVLGLAWSGGYGVQRKAEGAEQVLRGLPEIAGMAMMGLGGVVAVIGGLMFLLVVLRCMLAAPSAAASEKVADQ